MKKAISILLVVLLLFSNMGFALATHYCEGSAVESKLVFGHEVLDCGMGNMEDRSCQTEPVQEPHFKKKNCCENAYQSLNVEEEFKPTIFQSSINFEFVAIIVVSFLGLFFTSESLSTQQANYSPPLIDQDIPVLYQVFRI